MNKRFYLILLVLIVILNRRLLVAQEPDRAYFSADSTTSLIGEPFELVLHLHVPQNVQIALPDFTKSLSPLMVENVGSLKLIQQLNDTSVEYEVPLQVVLWRVGTYSTPALTVSYQLTGATAINLSVETLQFQVASSLDEHDLSLHPFKPLINLPYFPIWEVIPFIVMVVGIAIFLVRKRLTPAHKRTTALDTSMLTGHPDAVYALNVLRQIGESNPNPLLIYAQVSDCLRNYLAKRYSLPTLDLTTNELVDVLNEKAFLTDEHQQRLGDMLKRADLVKFARVVPKQAAAQQITSVASQWIQSVEQAKVEQPS
ncbi:MAG: hypothetical protein H0X30_12770 [Anaerolineae bacterium]|nr:hypothetical protein [Anaerolineae bacterium]